MTTQPEEPSEDTNAPGDERPQDSLMRQLQPTSGRPTGTPYQNRLMDAVVGSEHHDSMEFGVPTRRRGDALHITYDQAMEFLWPADGGH